MMSYDELQIKNDALQKRNEELEAEIRSLKYEYENYVDSVKVYIGEQKAAQELLINEIKTFITEQFTVRDNLQQLTDLELSLTTQSLEIQDKMIEYQGSKIERYKKAPTANKQNTDALWEPYRQKFDNYIADGKTESWAKNKIGELMQKDGVWKKASKNGAQKIITCPDRATLHRQLVTNRK